MWKFFRKINGSVMILTTLAMVALLGFAALAIDVGAMYTARNQLQAAVDSAALAGASALINNDTALASLRASQYAASNTCLNQSVNPVSVSFPATNRCRVDATRNINLYFARVLGMNTAAISARAIAQLDNIIAAEGVRPWAIPFLEYQPDQLVVLKAGDHKSGLPGIQASFYYPIALPPVGRVSDLEPLPPQVEPGADEYRENIIEGSDHNIYVGDTVLCEPGNMTGPTRQGVNELLASGTTRIIVPLYKYFDENGQIIDYDKGRTPYPIVGFAVFELQGMQGNDVVGRFLKTTTAGLTGNGSASSLLKGVHLVE